MSLMIPFDRFCLLQPRQYDALPLPPLNARHHAECCSLLSSEPVRDAGVWFCRRSLFQSSSLFFALGHILLVPLASSCNGINLILSAPRLAKAACYTTALPRRSWSWIFSHMICFFLPTTLCLANIGRAFRNTIYVRCTGSRKTRHTTTPKPGRSAFAPHGQQCLPFPVGRFSGFFYSVPQVPFPNGRPDRTKRAQMKTRIGTPPLAVCAFGVVLCWASGRHMCVFVCVLCGNWAGRAERKYGARKDITNDSNNMLLCRCQTFMALLWCVIFLSHKISAPASDSFHSTLVRKTCVVLFIGGGNVWWPPAWSVSLDGNRVPFCFIFWFFVSLL